MATIRPASARAPPATTRRIPPRRRLIPQVFTYDYHFFGFHSKTFSLVLGARLSFYIEFSATYRRTQYRQIEGKKTSKKGIQYAVSLSFALRSIIGIILCVIQCTYLISKDRNIVISFFNSQASKVKKNNKATHTHTLTQLSSKQPIQTLKRSASHTRLSLSCSLSLSHTQTHTLFTLNHSLHLHLRSHTHSTRSLTHCLIEQLLSLSHSLLLSSILVHSLLLALTRVISVAPTHTRTCYGCSCNRVHMISN